MTESKADVLIVGGGVVGLSVAYELSQSSRLKIVVVDKGGPGAGTSGRSAGVICRHDQGAIYQRLSLIGFSRMLAFKANHGLSFSQWGSLDIVRAPRSFPPGDAHIRELVDAPSGMYKSEQLEREELLARFPWIEPSQVIGGVFEPNIGFINPFELMDLYRKLLAEAGVEVDYGNPVLGFRKSNDTIDTVITRRGAWSAETVINASGAWANKVARLAGSHVDIVPQRMNVVSATTFDDGSPVIPLHGVEGLSWKEDGAWCRGETGGGALFGQHRESTRASEAPADPDFFDGVPDAGFVNEVRDAVQRGYRWPNTEVLSGWTCVYDTSPDGFPIVGSDSTVSNLIHAVGMNGHGMTIHPGIARCIAELVNRGGSSIDISDVVPWEQRLDFSILAPSRFAEGRELTIRGTSGGH